MSETKRLCLILLKKLFPTVVFWYFLIIINGQIRQDDTAQESISIYMDNMVNGFGETHLFL